MSDFKPLQIPPGVVRGLSAAVSPGNWFDANMIRWVSGNMRPVNGWDKLILSSAFATPVRAVHSWVDNAGGTWIGVLCEQNIYVVDTAGNVTEITPAAFTGPSADVLAGGYGNDLYGKYQYGNARPDTDKLTAVGPAWTLDNWGQNLLICSSYDGRLLQWVPNVAGGSLAAVVTAAPKPIRTFVVTPERYVMVFGGNDPVNFNTFSWCSQEDINDWNFADITNTAGTYTVEPASPILSAVVTRWGILMFSAASIYLIRYVSVPYVYTYQIMAGDAVPLSNGLVVSYAGRAFWMAADGFWTSDGASIAPVPCTILGWIRAIMDQTYIRFRGVSINLGVLPEVWIFFPSLNQKENDTYVIWNYTENWWSMGYLARTCGYRSSYTVYPILSDGANLFYHERSGSPFGDYKMLPYATCSFINANGGQTLTSIMQGLTDQNAAQNIVQYTFQGRITTRMNQNVPPEIQSDPPGPILARSDGYLDFRITARDIMMTVSQVSNDASKWSFGQMLLKSTFGRGVR